MRCSRLTAGALICALLIGVVLALLPSHSRDVVATKATVPLSITQQRQLDQLDRDATSYFLENQLNNGLILDRQRNSGSKIMDRPCSLSATGMGLIAIAEASSPELHMITRDQARLRVKAALQTALKLHQEHGMMPHFVDGQTLEPIGNDAISTIDSSWFIAGALWSANYLQDPELEALAQQLYDRVDWQFWSQTTSAGTRVIRHGMDKHGAFLKGVYDRYNSETAFMYVLALGAPADRALAPADLLALKTAMGTVEGAHLPSADLGLFVYQYSNELLDMKQVPAPGHLDFTAIAKTAATANYRACQAAKNRFGTYQKFWGLSAGDGPGKVRDAYRAYAPGATMDDGYKSPTIMDGTAHITATIASLSAAPDLVLQNIAAAESGTVPGLHGRYGYSNVNLDNNNIWVSQDVVGIDMGAEVFAIDNVLHHEHVRNGFSKLPPVRRAIARLKATP